MKIRVISEPNLTLAKERMTYDTGKILTVGIEIADEERANQILAAKSKGKPVAELIEKETIKEDTPKFKTRKKKSYTK